MNPSVLIFDPFPALLYPLFAGLAVITRIFFLGFAKVSDVGIIAPRSESFCVQSVPAEVFDGSQNFAAKLSVEAKDL